MNKRQEFEEFEKTLVPEDLANFEAGRSRRLDYDAKFQKWDALRKEAINEEMEPMTEAEIEDAWANIASRVTARIRRRRARR